MPHDAPEILDYEFVTEAEKIDIINEQITSLERDHFNWVLNRHRTDKMTLSGDEREELTKRADEALKRTKEAIEVAKQQREELESFIATPASATNGNI